MNSIPDDPPSTVLVPMLSVPGAEGAWRVFLHRYRPVILDWASRDGVGRDDAEEIASQVLLKLVHGRTLALFDRSQGRFRPWLRTVVRNVAFDFRRNLKRTPGGVGQGQGNDDLLDSLLDPSELDGLAGELDERLSRDLRKARAVIERVRHNVKPSSWEAYYHTAILGVSAVEVADALGLSVSAVYMAKQRVGQKLEKEGRAALG